MRIDTSGNALIGTTNSSASSGSGIKLTVGTNPALAVVGAASTNSDFSHNLYSTGAGAYRFYIGYGGTVYATSTTISGISDARLKENINTISDGLNTVKQLNPITYTFKNLPICDDGEVQHYGFLAQEVQNILPTLVSEGLNKADDGSKYLTLKMGDILPIMVKAIQELNAKVDAQAAEIATLKGNA